MYDKSHSLRRWRSSTMHPIYCVSQWTNSVTRICCTFMLIRWYLTTDNYHWLATATKNQRWALFFRKRKKAVKRIKTLLCFVGAGLLDKLAATTKMKRRSCYLPLGVALTRYRNLSHHYRSDGTQLRNKHATAMLQRVDRAQQENGR